MKRGMNGQKTKGSQSRRDKKYSPKGRGVYKHMATKTLWIHGDTALRLEDSWEDIG
jgi:hypothetical protein